MAPTSGTEPRRPRVGLTVEPRLLHDALRRALDERGVIIVDLRDHASCDIVLASEPETVDAPHSLVVGVGEAVSASTGMRSLVDVLDLIDGWTPSRTD